MQRQLSSEGLRARAIGLFQKTHIYTPIRVLLGCGIASTLLYFGMDVLAALPYDGYSCTGQTISELSCGDTSCSWSLASLRAGSKPRTA
jgi:hypothetical protein